MLLHLMNIACYSGSMLSQNRLTVMQLKIAFTFIDKSFFKLWLLNLFPVATWFLLWMASGIDVELTNDDSSYISRRGCARNADQLLQTDTYVTTCLSSNLKCVPFTTNSCRGILPEPMALI